MAEDRVSQFLAREREELGDIAIDLPGRNGNSGSDLDLSDTTHDSEFVIAPENYHTIEPTLNSSPVPVLNQNFAATNGHLNGDGERKESSTSSQSNPQENAILGTWKLNFEKDIKARDEKEEAKRVELEKTAKQELDRWYAHYREQMARRSAENRAEAPRDASGKTYEGFSGQAPSVRDTAVWESVCGMCDLTSKVAKSTHDLSRMRGLLLNLKTPVTGKHTSSA